MKKFGEKLRLLRRRQGITLTQLGDMLDVSYSYIGKMERGERIPNAAMITKIAQLFKISFDQLMNDEIDL